MGVFKNRGTPKSSILIGFPIINHPVWGPPIVGNTHICFILLACAIFSPGRCREIVNKNLSAMSKAKLLLVILPFSLIGVIISICPIFRDHHRQGAPWNSPDRRWKDRGHYITNPNNASLRGLPQIYHTFALFDPPKMGNLMIPEWVSVSKNTEFVFTRLPTPMPPPRPGGWRHRQGSDMYWRVTNQRMSLAASVRMFVICRFHQNMIN